MCTDTEAAQVGFCPLRILLRIFDITERNHTSSGDLGRFSTWLVDSSRLERVFDFKNKHELTRHAAAITTSVQLIRPPKPRSHGVVDLSQILNRVFHHFDAIFTILIGIHTALKTMRRWLFRQPFPNMVIVPYWIILLQIILVGIGRFQMTFIGSQVQRKLLV